MAIPQPEDLVAVALIAKPFGVRGEINAVPLVPAALDAEDVVLRRLYLRPAAGPGPKRGGIREVHGETVRNHQDRWLLKLKEFDTPEAIAENRGADLCLLPAELPPLPEGMFWEHELHGCRVIDAVRGDIGAAVELNLGGLQPRLVLMKSDGAKFEFPWMAPLRQSVDLAAREIRVALPEGWPGLDE